MSGHAEALVRIQVAEKVADAAGVDFSMAAFRGGAGISRPMGEG